MIRWQRITITRLKRVRDRLPTPDEPGGDEGESMLTRLDRSNDVMFPPCEEYASPMSRSRERSGPALTPAPWNDVTIDDLFWSGRLRANREQTLPHLYRFCKETGRIDTFRLDWKPGREPVPHVFWDSDVAKWLEAACYSLATHPDAWLSQRVDEVVALILAAQQPDGYLNTHFTAVEPEKRWTNLRDRHELYCAGHLMEAAVAHFQATGKRTLLDALSRYADYIDSVFGPEPGKKRGYPGHEEIELALVKLYRATGERRYLRLSQYFIEERGRQPHYYDAEAHLRGEDPAAFWAGTYEYNQSHLPVREQQEVTGHAVRAMYLYSTMTDLAREFHDASLLATCKRLWSHLCSTHLYLTGGIGSSPSNEGFTTDYDLPNESAYAETCAAIGLVFWKRHSTIVSSAASHLMAKSSSMIIRLPVKDYIIAMNGLMSRVAHPTLRTYLPLWKSTSTQPTRQRSPSISISRVRHT